MMSMLSLLHNKTTYYKEMDIDVIDVKEEELTLESVKELLQNGFGIYKNDTCFRLKKIRKDLIAKKGTDKSFGARPLRRAIQKFVEDELSEKILKKGTQLYVEGKLRTRSWEDKDGNKRYITEVLAENFTVLANKNYSNNQEEDTVVSPIDSILNASTDQVEDLPF